MEAVSEEYFRRGSVILDLVASQDSENLAFLRNPLLFVKKILITTQEGCHIQIPNSLREKFQSIEIKPLSLLEPTEIDDYDAIINPACGYRNFESYLLDSEAAFEKLLARSKIDFKRNCVVLVREGGDLFYSRLRAFSEQIKAKSVAIYTSREVRHGAIALLVDTLKTKSIEADLRAIADIKAYKALGSESLPDSESWLYHYVDAGWMSKWLKVRL